MENLPDIGTPRVFSPFSLGRGPENLLGNLCLSHLRLFLLITLEYKNNAVSRVICFT
jgi:hypothetical protein